MKISRGKWYRLLAMAILALMIYDRFLKEDHSFRLTTAIRCLVEKNGDGALCPQISIDPYLQKNLQNKFFEDFHQKEFTISIFPKDGKFEVQIQTTKSAGIVLVVSLRSKTDFQVVAWKEFELGDES